MFEQKPGVDERQGEQQMNVVALTDLCTNSLYIRQYQDLDCRHYVPPGGFSSKPLWS